MTLTTKYYPWTTFLSSSVAAPTPPGEHELRLPHSPCVSKSTPPPPMCKGGGEGEVCSKLGA
jgi:hypothetical protein